MRAFPADRDHMLALRAPVALRVRLRGRPQEELVCMSCTVGAASLGRSSVDKLAPGDVFDEARRIAHDRSFDQRFQNFPLGEYAAGRGSPAHCGKNRAARGHYTRRGP